MKRYDARSWMRQLLPLDAGARYPAISLIGKGLTSLRYYRTRKILFSIFFRILTEFFFNYKNIDKIIFQIFFNIFFFFFFEKLFLCKFFLSYFFWRKFFFPQKYFCKDFYHNIFADFFCIWCLRSFLFEILLIVNFFVLQFWCTEKKIINFFCDFFSAINVNT